MKLLIIIIIAFLVSNTISKHQEASKKAFVEMLKESFEIGWSDRYEKF